MKEVTIDRLNFLAEQFDVFDYSTDKELEKKLEDLEKLEFKTEAQFENEYLALSKKFEKKV